MSHSNAFEKFTDGTGRTFTTELLMNSGSDGPIRYTVVVTDVEEYAPYAWCGHSHRTETAANVCRPAFLRGYQQVRERVVARRTRESTGVT